MSPAALFLAALGVGAAALVSVASSDSSALQTSDDGSLYRALYVLACLYGDAFILIDLYLLYHLVRWKMKR